MKLSIVLSTQLTQFQAATLSGDLEPNLAQIAMLGYQGVELAIRDPRQVDYDTLTGMARRHNLEVPAIGTGQAWGEEKLSFTDPNPNVRQAAIDRIKSHIDGASRLNAVIIIGLIHGGVATGVQPSQAMDWLIAALSECCQAASLRGVRLALEPINRYETTLINNIQQGLDLIEHVREDNLGLLLDTYHMNIEEADMLASIRLCAKRIFHFHVADSNRHPPGGGYLDFKALLSALAATGYQGYISGEFMPVPDPLSAARENIAYLKPILDSIPKNG